MIFVTRVPSRFRIHPRIYGVDGAGVRVLFRHVSWGWNFSRRLNIWGTLNKFETDNLVGVVTFSGGRRNNGVI